MPLHFPEATPLPYRRFADTLAEAYARLGADVDCYSFIVVDLHHLLLAGLPAVWRRTRILSGLRSSRSCPPMCYVLSRIEWS